MVGEPHTQTHCCTLSSDSLAMGEENRWQCDLQPGPILCSLSQRGQGGLSLLCACLYQLLWSGTHL